MTIRKLAIAILVLIVTSVTINAQENKLEEQRTVIVQLNNGTVIEGEVNSWVIGEYIDLKTLWTDNFVLPSSAIRKIIQKSAAGVINKNHYSFKEEGIYYSGKIQFIAGNEGQRAKAINGLGLSFSAGKRFNRFVSVGAGIGYDRFIWNSGENIIPIFLEYTSFLNPKNTSLFFNVQAGYGLAFKNEDFLLREAKGGPMLYPSLGLRLGRYENKFTVDLGYKFQKAELTYASSWSSDISIQRLTYKRLALRLGILL